MARKRCIQFEGAFYHIIARGNQRQGIFLKVGHLFQGWYKSYLCDKDIVKRRRALAYRRLLLENEVNGFVWLTESFGLEEKILEGVQIG